MNDKPVKVTYSATTSDGTVVTTSPRFTRLDAAATHLVVGYRGVPWDFTWSVIRCANSADDARAARHTIMRNRMSGSYWKVEALPATVNLV